MLDNIERLRALFTCVLLSSRKGERVLVRLGIRTEGLDFGEGTEEPGLDVGEADRVAFGEELQLIVLLAESVGVLVSVDVGLHVPVGQTTITLLAGVALDLTPDHGIGRIVAARILKHDVFIRTYGFGLLGESPVHDESGVSGIDLKDVFHVHILLPSRDLFGSVVDALDRLAVVLTALLDFGKRSQEPGLDLEEGLRLAVLAVLTDGALGDEGKGGLLLIGAVLLDILLDELHVQGGKGGLGLLGLELDDAGTGIVTAGGHHSLVHVGPILRGFAHLGLGQFDGVGGEVDVHDYSFLRSWRCSVGRYPFVFLRFCFPLCDSNIPEGKAK